MLGRVYAVGRCPLNFLANLIRPVIAIPLLFCAGWCGVVISQVVKIPGTKPLGAVFLVIGAVTLLFLRGLCRMFYARTQSIPRVFAKCWTYVGESGFQTFYLGFGLLMVLTGCILIVWGAR